MSTSPPVSLSLVFVGQRVASLAMDANEDPYETGIVIEAAMSGSGAMIDVVVAAMSNLLNEFRVGMVFLCCPHTVNKTGQTGGGWNRAGAGPLVFIAKRE